MSTNYRPETLAVHAGQEPDPNQVPASSRDLTVVRADLQSRSVRKEA